jgi:hypothetical protein
VFLGPPTRLHKLDRVTIVLKGEGIGLFVKIVFVAQFNNGKQAGLKSWTRMMHAWKVDKEERDKIFNF